jgi:hypothetical protein
MDVIHAARNNRYMHGNGAQWFIVDNYGNNVMIDTTTQYAFATPVPEYKGTAYTCHTTAINLENFLMRCHGEFFHTQMAYHTAKRIVRDHVMDGNLMFTNGNQWYINNHGNVQCYELGVAGDWAPVVSYDALSSWRYIQSTGGGQAPVTAGIKEYLGIY